MHEEQKPGEYVFEKIKVDDIKENFLIEYKKTSANTKGARMQTFYYLEYFHKKGLFLKAKIIDLTYKKEYLLEYDENSKKELKQLRQDISSMLQEEIPSIKSRRKDCKGCSFYNYCWLP
jgi:CRISPR-associated exonuclease Cas4